MNASLQKKSTRLKRGSGCILAAALSLAVVPTLSADAGDGLNLGPAKVSTHLGMSTGFVSNALQANATEMDESEGILDDGSALLGINPGLAVELKNERFATKLQYEHYLRSYLSDQSLRRSVSYYNNYNGKLNFELFPNGMFGLRVYDRIRNTSSINQMDSDYLEILTSPDIEIGSGLSRRFYNEVGAEARYSPGAALDFFLGSQIFVENYYISSAIADNAEITEKYSEKYDLAFNAGAKWKFFPRTSLLLDSEIRTINYNAEEADRALRAWYVRTGLNGQITSTIQAVAIVGVGGLSTPEDSAADLTTGSERVIGQSSINWSPQDNQTLSFSFIRSFGDFLIADYYVNNAIAFRYSGRFYSQRVNFGASMMVDIRNVNLLANAEAAELDDDIREDQRYRFRIDGGYAVTDWLRMTGNYSVSLFDSSQDTLDFNQHLIMLGVRATY